MRGWIAVLAVTGALLAGVANAQSSWAQLTMENRTPYPTDLYVDGEYRCRALAGLTCTTQVTAGSHNLFAKTTNGNTTSYDAAYFAPGASETWQVWIEQVAQ